MKEYYDNRVRPAVELVPATVSLALAGALAVRPGWFFPVLPSVAEVTAGGLVLLGLAGLRAAWRVVRYRAGLRRLPRYTALGKDIPWSERGLWLGRGFEVRQSHTQRIAEAREPEARQYVEPSAWYRRAREWEKAWEHRRVLGALARWSAADVPWNPLRPLPPVGGDSVLHGVGLEEETDIWQEMASRGGHTLVLGTTGTGKTRLAEVMISQDIRRGDVVVVIDPKGDLDLLLRMFTTARDVGRLDQFHCVHLGYPEISERYNPLGEYVRMTEPATRLTDPMSGEGDSAAFKQFAWRFSAIVIQAEAALGRKPTYERIGRYIIDVEPLFVEYYERWLAQSGPEDWKDRVSRKESFLGSTPAAIPKELKGRGVRAVALLQFVQDEGLYDRVAKALESMFSYEKSYFDKLTASLQPLVEKLTIGESGKLLSPDYEDPDDPRPVLDWRKVLREGGIVYVGLDALADGEVAGAAGAAMFSDLTSVAGELYKHGQDRGLPGVPREQKKLDLYADEFNELVGKDFIPMVNKARGAGYRVTALTQTNDDIEAGIGSRPMAGQIRGNFNSIIMLRVRTPETAQVLTDQLPKVRVRWKTSESRFTDDNNPDSPTDFVSMAADRHQEQEVEMVTPADVMRLPNGQAYASLHGGRVYKLRIPLMQTEGTKEEVWRLLRERYYGDGA